MSSPPSMLSRINVFWLGAGGFLALFCGNEIVAYHLSRTPRWLGGPMIYAACVVGLLAGLSVMAFLGIEEPREEASAGAGSAAGESTPPDESSDPDVDEGDPSAAGG
jgi:hypothetical protein